MAVATAVLQHTRAFFLDYEWLVRAVPAPREATSADLKQSRALRAAWRHDCVTNGKNHVVARGRWVGAHHTAASSKCDVPELMHSFSHIVLAWEALLRWRPEAW